VVKSLNDIYLGAAVLTVLGAGFYALHNHHVELIERQARAEPAVLQACTEIAAHARGPFFQADGAVKEQCLLKFDPRYAQARAAEGG
jgi:hypothetical protein